jgi:hypothetical protein
LDLYFLKGNNLNYSMVEHSDQHSVLRLDPH